MGRINVVLPDELEERFRMYLLREYGLKWKGKISEHMTEALSEWLDNKEGVEPEEKEEE